MIKNALLLFFLTFFLFVSCGDDKGNVEVSDPKPDPKEEMRKTIKSHVSETCRYENFCFYITIRTDLSEEYPDKYFEYGIEMGYGAYNYYVYASGYGNIYSIEQPVFINGEDSPYSGLMFYWKSYQSLLADMANGPLTSSEQSLYNEIVKQFKNSESAAKSSFIYRIFIDVDGDRYYL